MNLSKIFPASPQRKRPAEGPFSEVEARAGVEPTYTDLQSRARMARQRLSLVARRAPAAQTARKAPSWAKTSPPRGRSVVVLMLAVATGMFAIVGYSSMEARQWEKIKAEKQCARSRTIDEGVFFLRRVEWTCANGVVIVNRKEQ